MDPALREDEALARAVERWYLAQEGGVDGAGAAPEGEAGEAEPETGADRPSLEDLVARAESLLADARAERRGASDALATPASASSPSGWPLVGRDLGPYRVLAPLGAGGMSRVYVAEDRELKRLVALKVLEGESVASRSARLRLRREAELTAALDHPHVAPVYAIGEEGGRVFIAMRLLRGRSLDRVGGPLAPRDVARFGAKIARALAAAHAAGVIHRDVKPSNVVVEHDEPYLLDFGLATGPGVDKLTREGAIPGTLHYLAPELLATRSRPADAQTDVYSLGATLYELLAGRPPFDADTQEGLVRSILLDEPARLRFRGADADVAVVVERALDRDRRRRFATADELAEELERCVERRPVRSRRIGPFARAWRAARRRPAVAALTVAAALGLGLFAFSEAGRRAAAEDAVRRAADALSAATSAADGLLAAGDYDGVRAQAERLPADLAARPEILVRLRRADALEAVDALLDLAQSPAETQDATWADLLAARVDPETLGPDARPRARVGLALAAWTRGDAAVALHLAQDADVVAAYPRGSRLLAAAFENRRGEVASLFAAAPKPHGPFAGEDAVVCDVALRLADAPTALRARALAEPDAAGPLADRLLYARAALARDRGAIDEAFGLLAARTPRRAHAPTVLAQTALIDVTRGDLDAAAARLERCAAAMRAAGTPDPWLAYEVVRLAYLRARGDLAGFAAALDRARAAFPRAGWLVYFAAVDRLGGEGAPFALGELARIVRSTADPRLRDAAESAAWQGRLIAVLDEARRLRPGAEDESEDLLEEVDAALAAPPTEAGRGRRADGELVRARLRLARGEESAAFDSLRAALRLVPDHLDAGLEFAAFVAERGLDATAADPLAVRCRARLGEALGVVRGVADRAARRAQIVDLGKRFAAERLRVFLAEALGETVEAREALAAARRLGVDLGAADADLAAAAARLGG